MTPEQCWAILQLHGFDIYIIRDLENALRIKRNVQFGESYLHNAGLSWGTCGKAGLDPSIYIRCDKYEHLNKLTEDLVRWLLEQPV